MKQFREEYFAPNSRLYVSSRCPSASTLSWTP